MAKQLFAAIDYLNNNGVIHFDVKAENVVYDDKKGWTLIDYGLSMCTSHEMNHFKGFRGTVPYIPPCGTLNDVDKYSYAYLMIEMVGNADRFSYDEKTGNPSGCAMEIDFYRRLACGEMFGCITPAIQKDPTCRRILKVCAQIIISKVDVNKEQLIWKNKKPGFFYLGILDEHKSEIPTLSESWGELRRLFASTLR